MGRFAGGTIMRWGAGGLALSMLASVPQADGAPSAATGAIRIEWDKPRPDRIIFEGKDDFIRRQQEFEGRFRPTGRWMLHNLAIAYGAYEVPLTVLSGADGAPVRFRVHGASYSTCDRKAVTAIWSKKPIGTVNDRIALMMDARRLLEVSGDACPALETRKMVKAYFRANCALAQDAESAIVMSRDAQDRYRAIATTPQEKTEAESCRGKAESRILRPLLAAQAVAAKGLDKTELDRVSRELLAYAGDPAWSQGFDALRIDADYVRAMHLRALYDMQLQAGRQGDPEQALELNQNLSRLETRADFRTAFDRTLLSKDRLTEDGALYQSIIGKPAAPR